MAIHASSRPDDTAAAFAIDVWADIACPWCYIGERRLEQAVAMVAAEFPEVGFTRRWRPFQLQPGISRRGIPWAAYVPGKFGPPERAAGMFAHVASVGAGVGLDLRFDRIATAPNTTDAHRLVLWAAEAGHEWTMANALFRAYFTDGRDLNDVAQLVAVARDAGLDEHAARDFLATSEHRDAVEAAQQEAATTGITGVPFFVLDERYAFSGAQPADAMAGAIRTALRDRGRSASA